MVPTGPSFFCHRENFFFCRPAQQVIFLCTLKHNGKANFKKFLNTGQRVGQRVGPSDDNHIYLNLDALKLNFSIYMTRKQILKIFCLKIGSFIYLKKINFYFLHIIFKFWILCKFINIVKNYLSKFWAYLSPSLP